MNIVFHRYNSICEPGYIQTFSALGIDVIEDTLEMTAKSIAPDVRIANIAELILKNRPMFVFSINFFPYISDICERLGCMYVCVSVDCPVAELFSISIRNKCNRIFLFDKRQFQDISAENPDCIFHLPLGVNPMISATDESADHTSYKATDGGFQYDVSFIGSLYNEKNPYADIRDGLSDRVRGLCEGLLAAQELFDGQDLMEGVFEQDDISKEIKNEFNKYIPNPISELGEMVRDMVSFYAVNGCLGVELTVRDRHVLLASVAESIADMDCELHFFTRSDTSRLKALSPRIVCHGGVSTLTEMPRVFASSKINLNTTMRPIRSGLPQRIWDVLGCGGFLLTNYQDELPENLEIGRHVEAYENVEEACEKVRYYLTHEDERLEITRNGYEACRKRHMLMNRVTSMIAMIMREDTGA